jgi:hypothetical protein
MLALDAPYSLKKKCGYFGEQSWVRDDYQPTGSFRVLPL